MHRNRSLPIGLISLLVLGLGATGTAQESETAAAPASSAQRQLPRLFKIPKEQISKYVLVRSFFRRGEKAIHSEVPGFYRDLLQRLGIERGSTEELALVDSIAGASLVLNVKKVDNSLKGREHMRFQLGVAEKQMKGLAIEFAKLIFELDRLGYPTDRLDVYLEERIRPSTGISISGADADYEALEIQSRFDDLLTKNLDKLRQRGGR